MTSFDKNGAVSFRCVTCGTDYRWKPSIGAIDMATFVVPGITREEDLHPMWKGQLLWPVDGEDEDEDED